MNDLLREKIASIPEIAQLDFEHDNELFIDPYRINENDSELMKEAKRKIIKYFDIFFHDVKNKYRDGACKMGKNLHEINATKLGYSNRDDIPKGKGFSQRDLLVIFDQAVKIRNYIEDMPDILVLAVNVGPDKVSDLTTNIIYEELLQFTIRIINKYKLNIPAIEKEKWIFNVDSCSWEKKMLCVPCIDGEEILFIPDKIVASHEIFSYETVYNKLVYPYYKSNTAIHRLIKLLKNGQEKPDCKEIKKKYPLNRETVQNFKMNYSAQYNQFKSEMISEHWRHEFLNKKQK